MLKEVEKKVSVTVNGKQFEEPFMGHESDSKDFSEFLNDTLTHPLISGRLEKSEKGKSIQDAILYALDLWERASARPKIVARLEGPDKAILAAAKKLSALYESLGKSLTVEEAVELVKKQAGI